MSDGFLSRWARRKQAVRTAERTETPVAPDTAAADAALEPTGYSDAVTPGLQPIAATEGREEAPPDDLLAKLPSLDSLTPDTDLSAFLQNGVPTALRNAALRRMWSLDPAIRDFVSEAREYAYDWNAPGGVPGMGPLLPTDDVKAMLKRVVGGVPPREQDAPAPEPSDLSAPTQGESAEADIAMRPESEPLSESLPAPHLAPNLAPVMAERLHAPVVVAEAETAEVAPPLPRPRLRRHGGAKPS